MRIVNSLSWLIMENSFKSQLITQFAGYPDSSQPLSGQIFGPIHSVWCSYLVSCDDKWLVNVLDIHVPARYLVRSIQYNVSYLGSWDDERLVDVIDLHVPSLAVVLVELHLKINFNRFKCLDIFLFCRSKYRPRLTLAMYNVYTGLKIKTFYQFKGRIRTMQGEYCNMCGSGSATLKTLTCKGFCKTPDTRAYLVPLGVLELAVWRHVHPYLLNPNKSHINRRVYIK